MMISRSESVCWARLATASPTVASRLNTGTIAETRGLQSPVASRSSGALMRTSRGRGNELKRRHRPARIQVEKRLRRHSRALGAATARCKLTIGNVRIIRTNGTHGCQRIQRCYYVSFPSVDITQFRPFNPTRARGTASRSRRGKAVPRGSTLSSTIIRLEWIGRKCLRSAPLFGNAEEGHHSGHLLQHVGEVLSAHDRRGQRQIFPVRLVRSRRLRQAPRRAHR